MGLLEDRRVELVVEIAAGMLAGGVGFSGAVPKHAEFDVYLARSAWAVLDAIEAEGERRRVAAGKEGERASV